MNPILEQFLVEARENLLYLDKNLCSIEDNDKELINALFRAAHTLKGSSGLAGFDSVKEITHVAEDLLDAYRNDKIQFSSDLLDGLFDMFDEVTELVDATEESGEISQLDQEKMDSFKQLRATILNQEDEVCEGIDTEIRIEDQQIPLYGSCFKNDFEDIDIEKLPFDTFKVSSEYFSQLNYYMVELDLDVDIVELGNDPFYSLFLLESENVISLYTEVSASYEEVVENPLAWKTRILAIVKTDQELLEDAFYNFMDQVTIYPLTIKGLFATDLEKQSNDSLDEFIDNLKSMIDTNSFKKLKKDLKNILEIVNKDSLQGFLFSRLYFILQNNSLSNSLLAKIVKEILLLISDEKQDSLQQESISKNENIVKIKIGTKKLEENEKSILKDIFSQQRDILLNVETDQVIEQVKSLLHNIESNLHQDFHLDLLNSKEELLQFLETALESFSKEESEEKVVEKKGEAQPKNSVQESTKKVSKALTKTVKVDLEDIDSMMDTVGEMLVIKNSLPYIAGALRSDNVELSKRELQARYDEINRVTSALQEKVMQMRLLSLSFIFDRYPKLIRDISKSLGKKINYKENGGDTKLDKTIIEKLADPLIHIIRNSLDHGIETPQERELLGKSPDGTISIDAQSIGDKVYINIQDDGKGIDVNKVVQKSLEKKMVDVETLENMSHQEKLMLIFHPGVSTMDQISELSGRGVGMDVVRKTIDDIGGKISLDSEVGIGTKLTFELPMSVALSNVFHIKLGDVNYALSMDSVSETVQVAQNEVEYINKKPMLKLRGDLIPLIFFYNLLSKEITEKESYNLLIIDTQGVKFGFIVDQFVNQLDIIQKPLSSNFKNHPFISGTSLLGNGEVLFVINPIKLISLKEKK